jgi:hypothetical protein
MYDYERARRVADLLKSLLNHPGETWDKKEIESMRIDVDCGEYENPLGNIIAMGIDSEQGFDARQIETLNALVKLMHLEDSEWVLKLREWENNHSTHIKDPALPAGFKVHQNDS